MFGAGGAVLAEPWAAIAASDGLAEPWAAIATSDGLTEPRASGERLKPRFRTKKKTKNMSVRNIEIANYRYELEDSRIALCPCKEREKAKLLILKPNGELKEDVFANIADFLPQNSFLVMNNTKVVYARLIFYKTDEKGEKGARIEIFCLKPISPVDISMAFAKKGEVVFECLVGNNKKWKSGRLCMDLGGGDGGGSDLGGGMLYAEKLENLGESFAIKFSYSKTKSFSDILESVGRVPLPPYINREDEESDKEDYQCVFAKFDGSVAAPTAGLHFSTALLDELEEKGIGKTFLCLHVGAGTFKPVKAREIGEHKMHSEFISIGSDALLDIITALKNGKKIISVGTTSMRSLESIFWWGVKLLERKENIDAHAFSLSQWEVYDIFDCKSKYDATKVFEALLELSRNNGGFICGHTSLIIAPSYDFMVCSGLITNFHQSESTLLVLVSAFIGEKWKEAYSYAKEHDFRFLSYGDACLFLR